MKRTPIRPSTKPRKRARVKPVNRKRRAESFARAYGEHADWIRSQPCIVADRRTCRGDVAAAHTENGGMSRKAHARTLVPACAGHHTLNTISMHNGEVTFQKHYRLNLKAQAAEHWQRSPWNRTCLDCSESVGRCDYCRELIEQDADETAWWQSVEARTVNE